MVLLTLFGLGGEPPDPAEILEKAVLQIGKCSMGESLKESWDEGHTTFKKLDLSAKDKSDIPKLTLPSLLRKGRYKLETVGEALFHGRDAVILNFSPLPAKERLKPQPGEDRNFVKAMNELKGSIYIDRETGRLISVEAKIESEINLVAIWKKFIPLPVTFRELTVQVKPVDELSWKPALVELKFDGFGPKKVLRRHEHHKVSFICAD